MSSVQNRDSVGTDMDRASIDMRKASANKLSIAELRVLIADIGLSDRVDAHTDKNELVNIVAHADCDIPTSLMPTPPIHVHTHAHTDIHTQTQAQPAQQAQAKKKKRVGTSSKKDKQRNNESNNVVNIDTDMKNTDIDIDIRAIRSGNKFGSKKKGGNNNNDNNNSINSGDVTDLLLNAISNLGVEMRALRADITAIQKKDEGKSVLDADKYICTTNTPACVDAAVAAVNDIPVNNANTDAMPVLSKSVYMKQGKKGSVKKVGVNSKKGKVGNRVGMDILNIAGIGDVEHKWGKNNEKKKGYNYDSGKGTDIDGVSDGDSDDDGGSNESDNGVSNRRSARYTPSYLSHNRVTNPDNITYTQLAQECSEAVSLYGGFYKYIHEREFRQARNRHECESIARVLDKLIHDDGIPVDRSVGIELLIRRLVGVQQSDASGDWTWATASELNDHSTSLLSMTSLKQLFKRVHLLNQLKPTNNYVRKNTYVHKYTGTDQDGQRTQYTSQRGGFRSQQRGGFRGSQRGGFRNNFNNRGNGRGSINRVDQTDGVSGNTPTIANAGGRSENAK